MPLGARKAARVSYGALCPPAGRCLAFILILSAAFALLTGASCVHGEAYIREGFTPGDAVETEAEFLATLRSYKQNGRDAFAVMCGDALFSRLEEDNFRLLYQLEAMGQIDSRLLEYRRGELYYTKVVYTDTPVCPVYTFEDAEYALKELYGAKGDAISLVCTKELFTRLFTDGGLYAAAARAGFEKLEISGSASTGICYVSSAVPYQVPFACVGDSTEFVEALARFQKENVHEFALVLQEDLFAAAIANDYQELYLWQALGQISSYAWTAQDMAAAIHYYDVNFSPSPRILCQSREDVVQVIRQMGREGITDFDLVLDRALYREAVKDDFALLYDMQRQGGMSRFSFYYNDALCVIGYTDAEIASDARQLSGLADAMAYVEECARREEDVLYLFCGDELYEELLEGTEYPDIEGMDYLADILDGNGIFHYTYYYSDKTHIITVRNIVYYPGFRIALAFSRNDLSGLTDRERQTLDLALGTAQQASSGDPMRTAQAIHDALCLKTVYVADDEGDSDDTAVGAFLEGKANCDGYSDAFYLAATLAGLRVRYQHGDTFSQTSEETHMWNLIFLDGEWRMVDVTWDDSEEAISYKWFLAGEDRAAKTHLWNRATSEAIAAETDMERRPRREFIVSSEESLEEAVQTLCRGRYACAEIFFIRDEISSGEEGLSGYEDIFGRLHEGGIGNIRYSWQEDMKCLFLITLEYG